MFGDMNTVRKEQERVGSIFNNIEADYFNSFIDATGLVDLPIRGRCFTWMNKAGTKLSKLNRFLISEDVIDLLLDIRITTLDRIWSDHNPILLHVDKIDFGPSSFKLYNSWLLRDGFDDLIKSEWDSLDSNNFGFPIKCHEKFRILKAKIRQWNNNNKNMKRNRKAAALEELSSIKKKIDEGSASHSDTENRLNLLHELEIIDKFSSTDLIQKDQDIIKKDLHDFINFFFASCDMPYGANSSFFTLIPKVNNSTLITDFRPISLIGIHYKIITKILANQLSKVIDKIISKEQSTFIIKTCLSSSKASILVNGSPTSGFSINRGLRQGDPLSPFLFILVMEGLHNAFADAVGNGLISGININNSSINISHLFFADDVIITTGWNARDLENIIRVLHVFYLASGLKINIHKSNIYGIGVNEDEVYNMASNAGCIAGNIPFNYLGLPIGSNMKSIASWKMLIDRFRSRLSTWKASLLSIGGRLTLIKSVLGSLGIYYLSIFRAPESVLNDLERIRSNFFWGGNQDGKKMAWVKWPIILNSYDNGGLNIGSLKAFNLALLQKWRWRLFTSPNDLWVKVVKAFHGHEGGFDNNGCSFKGTWANIVGSSNFLHSKGIILNNSFRFNAGCGTRIRFWKDIWVGEAPLSIRYNRLYRLDLDKDCLIIDRIINGQWHWNWSRTNIGIRNLAFFRDMLNEIGQLNIVASEDTCVWNLGPNGTLLRLNLSLRGMDIPAISCFSCNANVKSANHIFFECIIAFDLWKLVYRWCEIPFVQTLSFEAFKDWLSSWHAPKEKKHMLFIISTSRQFDFILVGLAEVPSNDRVFGQWLIALFQKASFLSRLLPRGLFGVSSKTTSE
ncbi:RNA-directed DNA polymerase, eukaryota, reverse transcriptase zinc-binding domain protein [Tanacetum coccineum]